MSRYPFECFSIKNLNRNFVTLHVFGLKYIILLSDSFTFICHYNVCFCILCRVYARFIILKMFQVLRWNCILSILSNHFCYINGWEVLTKLLTMSTLIVHKWTLGVAIATVTVHMWTLGVAFTALSVNCSVWTLGVAALPLSVHMWTLKVAVTTPIVHMLQ